MAIKNIINNRKDRQNIWVHNMKMEYYEQK